MSLSDLIGEPSSRAPLWAKLNLESLRTKTINVHTLNASDCTIGNIDLININSQHIITSDIRTTHIITNSLDLAGMSFISSPSDFNSDNSTIEGNSIVLKEGYSYYLTRIVDLQGKKIKAAPLSAITGNSLETSGLKSTGLDSSEYLLTSNCTFTCNNVKFLATGLEKAVDFVSSDGQSTLDWHFVNFVDFDDMGRIINFDNCIFDTIGFLNSGPLEFNNAYINVSDIPTYYNILGSDLTITDPSDIQVRLNEGDASFGTISFTDTLFSPKNGNDALTFPKSTLISRRFRATYSSFVNLGGVSIDVSSDAIIPVDSFILDTINFSGFGTFETLGFNDNRSNYSNCKGIVNTSNGLGAFYFNNNASITTITNSSDYFEIVGTGIPSEFNQRYIVSDTHVTYVGALENPIRILATISISSGNNKVFDFAIFKNDDIILNSEVATTTSGAGRSENISTFGTTLVEPSDVFTVKIRNTTDTTDVTVEELHFQIGGT